MTDANNTPAERRAQPPLEGWHWDKKVPISLIILMLSQFTAGIWAFADLKKDVELLKAQSVVLHERDDKQQIDMAAAVAQVRDQYKEVNAKLDRLIERSMK